MHQRRRRKIKNGRNLCARPVKRGSSESLSLSLEVQWGGKENSAGTWKKKIRKETGQMVKQMGLDGRLRRTMLKKRESHSSDGTEGGEKGGGGWESGTRDH